MWVGTGEPPSGRARQIGVKHDRYRPGMHTFRQCAVAALVMVAAMALAGCGGSTVVAGPAKSSTTPSPTSSATPDEDAPTSATVVVRSGGIAGVRDIVRIAADGTAHLTTKTGTTRACTPSAASLDRLAAIDLGALKAIPSKPSQMADGFIYSVQAGDASASAGEGDDNGRRAEFVDAAAAVIGSCLATQS
jgi:hypothetical protein